MADVMWSYPGAMSVVRGPSVERRLLAPLQLLLHVFADEVHRDVPGPLVHDLHVVFPRNLRQLALRLELGELGFIVGVGNRPGPQAVAK